MLFKSDIKRIAKSGLFDAEYYLQTYPDVKAARIDPLKHFVKYGWKEGRNPTADFDTNFYLSTYPDVAAAGVNPLLHYLKYGKNEGRKCNPSDDIVPEKTKVSKIRQLFRLGKHAKNNPQLIQRAVDEIRLHGLKKTIIKIKNKYEKIEALLSQNNTTASLDGLMNFFNKEKVIPKFNSVGAIDIVIPVYNGYDFLEPLISSILKNTSMDYRVLICDDKSSDERVLPLLKKLKDDNPSADIFILENDKNLGFIKTVNKLVAYTNNHFVLLNTDTEVPPFWIERLMYPIFEMENIASTTPFTNAGTICSFPNYLEDNPIFEGMNVETLDDYFQYVNFEKTVVEIPTGVGFCMGVNKTLVDKIGMFDEIFGKGYGEENDWCQRAINEGYKNLHVTNLFVYHKHGGSFASEEKQKLISKNLAVLNQKYPSYNEQIQQLIQKNALESLRRFLQIKIKNQNFPTTLIVDHGLGGGANHYIDESIEKRIQSNQLTILLRYDFNVRKIYAIRFIAKGLDCTFSSNAISDVSKVLACLNIQEIFLNSFVSYPNVKESIEEIIKLQKTTGAKLVLPIHDYFPVCPSYTLLDEKMRYCGVPDNHTICARCLVNNKNEFKIFEAETNIDEWRKSWGNIIDLCDEVLCFSNSSKEIFLKAYPGSVQKINVVPHDISGRYPKIYLPDENSDKTVIGVLGGINEAKGAKIVKDLVAFIDRNNLNAKVVVIGQISIPIHSDAFTVTGKYDKKDLPGIVKKYKITKFLIPSIWPETFSYTTEEIMQMGYPLFVFDLGAPAERVKNYTLGNVIKIDQIHEVIFEY